MAFFSTHSCDYATQVSGAQTVERMHDGAQTHDRRSSSCAFGRRSSSAGGPGPALDGLPSKYETSIYHGTGKYETSASPYVVLESPELGAGAGGMEAADETNPVGNLYELGDYELDDYDGRGGSTSCVGCAVWGICIFFPRLRLVGSLFVQNAVRFVRSVRIRVASPPMSAAAVSPEDPDILGKDEHGLCRAHVRMGSPADSRFHDLRRCPVESEQQLPLNLRDEL